MANTVVAVKLFSLSRADIETEIATWLTSQDEYFEQGYDIIAVPTRGAGLLLMLQDKKSTRKPSVDNFVVPDNGETLVDNNAGSWTIGTGQAVLRNYVQVGGGAGDLILFFNGIVYVRGTDMNWYQWHDAEQHYTLFGPDRP